MQEHLSSIRTDATPTSKGPPASWRRLGRLKGASTFALSPDLLEAGRINVYERWDSDEDLHRFRGSGRDVGQLAALLNVQVTEYAVVERPR